MTQIVTIASTGSQFNNAKKHKSNLENLIVISPFQVKDLETVQVPFSMTTAYPDIFWRLIYTVTEDFVFVSSDVLNFNYEAIQKIAEIDNNIFAHDPSIQYTFGNDFSCNIFKMKLNRFAFVVFKTMEYAYRNKESFERFIWAPDRKDVIDTQILFSHSIPDGDYFTLHYKDLICHT